MRNKYAGKCFKCFNDVNIGEGFFQSSKLNSVDRLAKTKWVLRCKDCVGSGNKIKHKIITKKKGIWNIPENF